MGDIKAEIQAQMQKVEEAMVSKKLDEIITFYTEDCRVQPAGAPMVSGKEALKQFLGCVLPFMDKISKIENTVVEAVLMATGLACSVNTAISYDKEGKVMDNAKSMTVWKKVDDKWSIHWTAWSSDKPTTLPTQS